MGICELLRVTSVGGFGSHSSGLDPARVPTAFRRLGGIWATVGSLFVPDSQEWHKSQDPKPGWSLHQWIAWNILWNIYRKSNGVSPFKGWVPCRVFLLQASQKPIDHIDLAHCNPYTSSRTSSKGMTGPWHPGPQSHRNETSPVRLEPRGVTGILASGPGAHF